MSRSTIAVVTVLVLALLGSTAGLVMAGQTTPDFAGQPAILAPGPVPQPADDGHHDGSHFKFEGAVTAENLSGDPPTGNIVVTSGEQPVTVKITADTEIEHGPIQVGDWVEVKGQPDPNADRTVIAEKVEVKEHHDEEGGECQKEEFYGLLKVWTGDTWTIKTPNGLVDVLIDAQTEIKGTPATDVLVEVEACRQAGTLLARELKVRHHGDHGHDDRVEFRGTINELPAGAPFSSGPPWKGVWKVGDWFVEVTTDTAIVGLPELNREAEVHGAKAPEGYQVGGQDIDAIASKIEIEDHHSPGSGVDIVEIQGHLGATPDLSNGPVVWDIEDIQFTVDNATLIDDHHVSAGPDVWAEVHAEVLPDGSYHALRVKTEFEVEHFGEVHFKGTFEGSVPSANGVSGDEDWTVSGQTFIVPSGVGPSVAPVVGDRVKIKATHDATAGTYQAFKVEVRGEDHD